MNIFRRRKGHNSFGLPHSKDINKYLSKSQNNSYRICNEEEKHIDLESNNVVHRRNKGSISDEFKIDPTHKVMVH